METIEQARKYYAETRKFASTHRYDELSCYDGFLEGFRFAQRWTKVEDDEPEEGSDIICKDEDDFYDVIKYRKDGITDGYLKTHFTHWRQINHK